LFINQWVRDCFVVPTRGGELLAVTFEKEVMTMDSDIVPDAELDCVGLYCPLPIAMTKEEIDKLEVGQVLKVEADDPAAEEDIKRWAKRTGHEILRFEKEGTILTFFIKRTK
jgi:tRNA 2-thiouridine synthesizing protein A